MLAIYMVSQKMPTIYLSSRRVDRAGCYVFVVVRLSV